MTILTGLVAHYQASAGLVALCANRFYPITSPQNPTYPYILFQRISIGQRAGSHNGDSKLEQARFQFTINAKTAMAADQIREALIAAFVGYAGMMGDVYTSGITLANDIDDYDPVTFAYKRNVDLMIWHRPQA